MRPALEAVPWPTPAPAADAGNSVPPGFPEPDMARDRVPGPLGAPPPYRTVEPVRRPARPRVEMAPVPPTAPFDIRALGTLGPPPPYRPIIQAAAAFARGPAPDLEPWRLASLTRVPGANRGIASELAPGDPGVAEADWSLFREPEPKVLANFGADQEARSEYDPESGPRDLPLRWPVGAVAPRGTRPPGYVPPGAEPVYRDGIVIRARKIRPVLWAAGIVVTVLVAGVTLYAWRGTLMRALPAAIRTYVAPGQAGSRSSAADFPEKAASVLVAKCADGRPAGTTRQSDSQGAGCEGSEPATAPK